MEPLRYLDVLESEFPRPMASETSDFGVHYSSSGANTTCKDVKGMPSPTETFASALPRNADVIQTLRD